MAEVDNMEFWRRIMGDSDSDNESVFERFTLEEINKKDESDVDLDVVVNNDRLLEEMDESDSVGGADSWESSESDILPPIAAPSKRRRRRRQTKTGKKKTNVKTNWSDNTKPIRLNKKFDATNPPVGPIHDLPADANQYDFFSLLISESFWETAAEQTNLYADQKQAEKGPDKNWTKTTAEEMKLFIFIQFMFGIHKMPDTTLYWSSDPLLRVPAIADVMSRNRFQKLSQYFHLADNSKAKAKGHPDYDPLYKVRPLLTMVQDNSHAHYNPGRDIAIDEAMIKFNGRLSFKQYMKGKPNPWGIKVWCAADSRTGFMLDFSVYQGKTATPMPHGLGYQVVMTMGERHLNAGHHLFFDNYFSSVKLAQDLEKEETYMCSTIRLNRAGWPKELGSAVAKKLKPGDVLFQQDGNMVATLWKDKRPVAILSTNAEAAMGKQERKAPGGKREVPVSEPVLVYNSSMGGVDLADQYAAYYSVGRPSIRWWSYLCWWLLQTAMVNAFILWRDSQTKEPASSKRRVRHIDFRLAVLRALCAGKVSRKRAAPQAPSQAGVTDSKPLSHRSVRLPGRKKICQQCKRKGVRTAKGHGVETVFGCPICLVHLSPALCFAEFHQALAQSV